MKSLRSLSGGDTGQVDLVELSDGTRAVRKRRPGAPPHFFAAEAHGLDWLRATDTLRLPRVLEVGRDYLLLEWLAGARKAPDHDQQLGQQLAALHRREAGQPGLDRNNFVGAVPQDNRPCPSWTEFLIQRRLKPLLTGPRVPSSWTPKFQRLFERLPALIPDEPLSPLHGDLWGGNVITGPNGEPCLIDPAAYVGHREMDLAMMRLFGGFSAEVWSAYEQHYPLAPNWQSRLPLYQLYPLLVHVHMFGGSYLSSVESALHQLGIS